MYGFILLCIGVIYVLINLHLKINNHIYNSKETNNIRKCSQIKHARQIAKLQTETSIIMAKKITREDILSKSDIKALNSINQYSVKDLESGFKKWRKYIQEGGEVAEEIKTSDKVSNKEYAKRMTECLIEFIRE